MKTSWLASPIFWFLAIAGADAQVQPNVLFIMVDDLRPALGCYGDPLAITPNLDRFAESARVFQRAYCHQAVCGPSRTSILTGRLPDNTRVWHNRNLFRTAHPNLITLPQLFKQHGYHTQSLGKIFSGNEKELDPISWTIPEILRPAGSKNYLLPENQASGKQAPLEFADVADADYPDGQLAELAVATLSQLHRADQPFFLAIGFLKPHLPFTAPRRYLDLHAPEKFATPQLARPDGAPAYAFPDHLELAGYRDVPADEQLTNARAAELRRAYYACVTYVDAQIGKLLQALQAMGLDQRTIVVILGDHGYSLGEMNHWCKDTNFESDTHVPLLIHTPDMQQGAPTHALVEYVDIYPTLVELAGLHTHESLDGHSLVPILQDPQAQGRELVLSQFSRPFKPAYPALMGYSIRTHDHRYTRWIDFTTQDVLSEELYVYADPRSVIRQHALLVEQRSVADAEPVTLARLSRQLDEVLQARVIGAGAGAGKEKGKRAK